MARLDRLLRPRSIAVIGGGAWCENVISQCQKMGFAGSVWPVHPRRTEISGKTAFARLSDLPQAADAAFVGVNRDATLGIVEELQQLGAGGAVCFASGFAEAEAELEGSAGLQDQLLSAAGEMPILGPNCYGFINYLDGALLWPDQHGGLPCDNGVAILTQSSNIAINLTMQARGLPVAYVVTVGNQAQTSMAETAQHLLSDPRVTAIGLHIEGFHDIRAFEALAAAAQSAGKRIVALKVGKSMQAQQATVSHTASVAGSDAGAQALMARLGILAVDNLPVFLETLKLVHVLGGITSPALSALSCSGGEASLIADAAQPLDLHFPVLKTTQKEALRGALGPKVALANPLDYHTYVWNDVPGMADVYAAMMVPEVGLTLVIVDFPRADRCDASDWASVTQAAIQAKTETGLPIALVATLPEAMPEATAQELMGHGIVPLSGLDEALAAVSAASKGYKEPAAPLVLAEDLPAAPILVPEAQAKQLLSGVGLRVPNLQRAASVHDARTAAESIGYPVVLKGEGLAHKTEAGAVALNLTSADEVADRASQMDATSFLVEEMIDGAVAELLIGVVADPAHGFVLTLAAGGVLTELLGDRQNLLLPASDADLDAAIAGLRIARLLDGYRGAPAADLAAIKRAVRAIERFVIANAGQIAEVEVNPLICTPNDAIAVDALIRKGPQDD